MNGNKGYTFLELVIVLVLLGLVSMLTVPRFQALMSGNELERAARNLSTVILHTRGLAAGEGRGFVIHLDLGKAKYWVSREIPPTESRFEKEEVLEKRSLPESVKFRDVETLGQGLISDGEGIIHFWRNGLVETATIHLQDSKERQMTLIVNPITGFVEIEPSYVRQAST